MWIPSPATGGPLSWVHQFGTFDQDEGEAIAVDATGASWVVGMTSATLPGQKSAGTIDAFIRHYDPAGNERWTRQFGTWENDFARGVALDRAGNAYVAGRTMGTLPGQQTSGGWDGYLRKYDPAGTEVWTRQFGSGGGEALSGVVVDDAGTVTVAGTTRGQLPGQKAVGEHDGFVRRYDTDGNEVWTRQFGSPQDDFAVAVTVGPSGETLVTGCTNQAGAGAARGLDVFLRRYDPTGRLEWSRHFGSPADDYGLAVSADPQGNIYVAGSTSGTLPGGVSSGLDDAFVRKYDTRGAVIWLRQFGTPGMDDAEGIAVGPEGNISLAGRLNGTVPPQRPNGGPDIYAAELDPAGKELWLEQFGSDKPDYALSLALDQSGGLYLTGGTLGTLPGQERARERDAFVARLG